MAGLVSKIQNKLTQRRLKTNSVIIPRTDNSSHKPLSRINAKNSLSTDTAMRHNSNSSCSSTKSGCAPNKPPRSTQSTMTFSFSSSPISELANGQSFSRSMVNLSTLGKHVKPEKASRNSISSDTNSLESEVFELSNDNASITMNNLLTPKNRHSVADIGFYDYNSKNLLQASKFESNKCINSINKSCNTTKTNKCDETLEENNNRRNKNTKNPRIYDIAGIKRDDTTVVQQLSNLSNKNVNQWTNEDLIKWVIHIGMPQLQEPIKGSGLRGIHLCDLTEDSLVALGLTDATSQRRFLSELSGVLNKPLSLWSLQQASLKRRDLEKSTDVLFANLENLQKLNEEQEQLICTSMKELQLEQEVAEELLRDVAEEGGGVENLTSEEKVCSKEMMRNIYSWTTDDIVRWLRMNALEDFVPSFTKNAIRGTDIMDKNLSFLDKLGEFSTRQKESLYSALYSILNPAPSNSATSDFRKIETESDKQKYIAAVQAARSQTSAHDFLRTRQAASAVGPSGRRDGRGGCVGGEKDVNTARSADDDGLVYADVIDCLPLSPGRKNFVPRPASAFAPSQVRTQVTSLYSQIGREQEYCIHCLSVSVKRNRVNFAVNVPEKGHVIVASTNNKLRLQKDDRILEVCGQFVHDVSLAEVFYDMIKDKTSLQLVILRNREKQISDKDELRVLQNKIDVSEQHWSSLRKMLKEMRDDDPAISFSSVTPTKPNEDFDHLRQEKEQLEEALADNVEKVGKLQQALEDKNRAIQVGNDEKKELTWRLERVLSLIGSRPTAGSGEINARDPRNRNHSTTRADILRVLTETSKQTGQPNDLDQLLKAAVDKSPWLLHELTRDLTTEGENRTIGTEWC